MAILFANVPNHFPHRVVCKFILADMKSCACAGKHGAVSVPGGGERGVSGGGFQAQPAALLQGRPGLEHTAAQLSGHRGRKQVGTQSVVYHV